MKANILKPILNTILFFTTIVFMNCNNDSDEINGGNKDISTSKVKTYSIRYSADSSTPTFNFTYLENGNLDVFNYNNLYNYQFNYVNDYEIEYVNKTVGNFTNGQPKVYINYQLDSNKRITAIISGILEGRLYKQIFTYNTENYLIKVQEFEDYRSSTTGIGNGNYKLYEENILQWQDGNLVQWNEKRYDHNEQLNVDIETRFSDFLPENINTIGIKNYGFNFFGKGGIPEDLIINSNINFQVFAGKLLPSKSERSTIPASGTQIRKYVYNKDTQGRILECNISNETEVIENKLFSYTN